MAVRYLGLKDFTAAETEAIKNLTQIADRKIQRDFKNSTLIVDVHKFEKGGERCKYSVHLRLEDPIILLTAEQADWDLARALHKTIANLGEEMRHTFKKDVTKKGGPKPYPA